MIHPASEEFDIQRTIGRGEVLARLRALADDTRLAMLALLTQRGELTAKEIMGELELSQPMASRHLKYLHSTGYVLERRLIGATKAYSVVPLNVATTLQAVEQLLAVSTPNKRDIRPAQHTDVERFTDAQGRITVWPTKQRDKQYVLEYLVKQFEPDRVYSEREVNDLLTEWHTFADPVSLRRALYEYGLLNRERDGSRYWVVKHAVAIPPRPTIELRAGGEEPSA